MEKTPPLDPPLPKTEADLEVQIDKALRLGIDANIQSLKAAKPSRERSLAITKLQEAVMWLGMDLKRISEENPGRYSNPYPESYNPESKRIEPTADGLKL